jgi:hypothetical protein
MSSDVVRHWFFGIPPFRRLLLIVFILLAVLTVAYTAFASGREFLSRWRFSRTETHLLQEIEKTQQRAILAEGKAIQANALLIAKDRELENLKGRLESAENALGAARNVTVRFKNDYDQARKTDLSSIAPDAARLCAELYTLGYACRPRL